jgi:hypothetical protein
LINFQKTDTDTDTDTDTETDTDTDTDTDNLLISSYVNDNILFDCSINTIIYSLI